MKLYNKDRTKYYGTPLLLLLQVLAILMLLALPFSLLLLIVGLTTGDLPPIVAITPFGIVVVLCIFFISLTHKGRRKVERILAEIEQEGFETIAEYLYVWNPTRGGGGSISGSMIEGLGAHAHLPSRSGKLFYYSYKDETGRKIIQRSRVRVSEITLIKYRDKGFFTIKCRGRFSVIGTENSQGKTVEEAMSERKIVETNGKDAIGKYIISRRSPLGDRKNYQINFSYMDENGRVRKTVCWNWVDEMTDNRYRRMKKLPIRYIGDKATIIDPSYK